MQTSWNENRAVLRGRMEAPPVLSHVNHGVEYLVFPLAVPRLSGTEDRLNVVAARPLLEGCPLSPGEAVEVLGEVRSFNDRTGPVRHLVITLFAKALARSGEEPENRLILSGAVCKPPVLRRTPLGREICDLMLAVNRRYGRADYLPCIAWGSLAHRCGRLEVGDRVALEGRLQSRIYQKSVEGRVEERTAFEVSVMHLEAVEEEVSV